MSLPYFPFYPTDFEAKTSHLTMLEDGAYNRLLRLCWMTPGCSLPDDEAWIMRRVRASSPEERAAVVTVLAEFFEVEDGRLFSPRLRKEAMLSNERHARRVEAGKKGGRPPASLKTNDIQESNSKAGPKQPEPEPEPVREEPPYPPKEDRPAVDRGPSFSDFWNQWPLRKQSKPAAETAFKRLSVPHKIAAVANARRWGETWRREHPDLNDIHPATYLNKRRWEDEGASRPPAPTGPDTWRPDAVIPSQIGAQIVPPPKRRTA